MNIPGIYAKKGTRRANRRVLFCGDRRNIVSEIIAKDLHFSFLCAIIWLLLRNLHNRDFEVKMKRMVCDAEYRECDI